MSDPRRYLVVHGHFYQPPRENPWIEEIEHQESAAPYHDWNDRIAAECYGPNSASRLVSASNAIIDIINNFAKISFNVGPTLLAYLERKHPLVYRKILDADQASRAARRGHGNAIAQAYNHAILPLAAPRDRDTQIRWGVADFRRRFGRDPEGLWLPECAVDEDALCRLVDEGIRFTILGAGQARRFRGGPTAAWAEGVDPRVPYVVRLPGGRAIQVCFYDGGVAQDISFGGALRDRDAFVDRLLGAFGGAPPDPAGPWLVNVATDGETFGHHRPFGDMVLAAAIERIEREQPAELTNYAAVLEAHPPTWEAEVHYPSSWSCGHGVARWLDDCGCTTNAQPGWHQKWRRPLREALDGLREQLAEVYERRGGPLLGDVWRARDEYIHVILDRSPETVDAFLSGVPLGDRAIALKLLEMQRHALLMYTSCGWFFGELSGVESVQVLKYAMRAVQLAREVDGVDLAPGFQEALRQAPSNLFGDGARVLLDKVLPSVVKLGGVIAHHAISSLFEAFPSEGEVFCYRYRALDQARRSRAPTALVVGRVHVESQITREATTASYAVLHFGGHDIRCAVRATELGAHDELRRELFEAFERRSVGDVVRAVDRLFGAGAGREYGLNDLFLDERRKIVRIIVDESLERRRRELVDMFEESRPLLRFLVDSEMSIPDPLRGVADYTLSTRFVESVRSLPGTDGAAREALAAELHRLQKEAKELGAALDIAGATTLLGERILAEMQALAMTPRRETARQVLADLELAARLGLSPDLWEAQNLYWTLMHEGPRGPDAEDELLVRLGTRLGLDQETLEHALTRLRRSA